MGRRIGKTAKVGKKDKTLAPTTSMTLVSDTRTPEPEVLAKQAAERDADRVKHNERRAQFGE